MSIRSRQSDGAKSCAAPEDFSWLASLCDPLVGTEDDEERRTVCAQPYRIDREGEPWVMATDGILVVLLRQPSDFDPIPAAAAKRFLKFVANAEKLEPFASSRIHKILAWASVRSCPLCDTPHVPLGNFPSIAANKKAVAAAFLGITPIDKRQLMRVLPRLKNSAVKIGSTNQMAAICGDDLTICLAPIDSQSLHAEIRDSFEDFKALKKPKA